MASRFEIVAQRFVRWVDAQVGRDNAIVIAAVAVVLAAVSYWAVSTWT